MSTQYGPKDLPVKKWPSLFHVCDNLWLYVMPRAHWSCYLSAENDSLTWGKSSLTSRSHNPTIKEPTKETTKYCNSKDSKQTRTSKRIQQEDLQETRDRKRTLRENICPTWSPWKKRETKTSQNYQRPKPHSNNPNQKHKEISLNKSTNANNKRHQS